MHASVAREGSPHPPPPSLFARAVAFLSSRLTMIESRLASRCSVCSDLICIQNAGLGHWSVEMVGKLKQDCLIVLPKDSQWLL